MQTTSTDNSARNGFASIPTAVAAPASDDRSAAPALPAAENTRAPHDLLTRLRDKWGNRLAWGSAFSIPSIEDVALDKTPLAAGLQVIEAALPGRAATLHHFYDHKLRDALGRFRHVLAEETAALEARNTAAAGHNADLLARRQVLEAERAAATASFQEAQTALEDGPLAEAHSQAAETVARAGGTYDPQNPGEGCVLRHARTALQVLAARLRLPGPHGDVPAHASVWVSGILTVAVGSLVGLSLGIATHVLEADTLTRLLPFAGVLAAFGVCLAALAERGVHGAWYRVGQDYYLGCPRSKWGAMLAVALLCSLVILGVDVFLERQGLLALMQLQADTQALTGHAASRSLLDELASWIVPFVVTFAYLCCAGSAGYLHGRREEVLNRLQAQQEQEWIETDTARRADPTVQEALHTLSHVREMMRRREGLTTRLSGLAAPFDAEIAKMEGQRLPERQELDEAAERRVQDALDNFHGAQYTFDVMWEQALAECEGAGGGWQNRLQRAFGGTRPRRRTRREDRVRGDR